MVTCTNDRLMSRSRRVKSEPTLHLHLQQRAKEDQSAFQQPPDWIEAANLILKASGPIIPPLIISDNNIGLVTVGRNENKIIHKFLVRKGITKATMVHQTVVEIDHNGKNKLEDLVRAKMYEIVQK